LPEFRFHHLERRRLDAALPELVEAALADGKRVVVQAGSPEEVAALNERLWTYSDESFLPHGAKADGDADMQPVYLTDEADNPNGASVRALLSGADVSAYIETAYEFILILFDSRDPDALAKARAQWTQVRAAGAAQSYWREGDDGGWVKAR
jgi:DNA polymerase III subunit chi